MKSYLEQAFGRGDVTSARMQAAIREWLNLYYGTQHAPNGKEQQINNSSTTRHALCSVPEMAEMISETCEAHAVYFYPKTGKKC